MKPREDGLLQSAYLSFPGEEYVACLPDNSSDTMVLVAFSIAHEGPLAPEACSTFCFLGGQGLAALSEQGQCLCGTAQTPNISVACLSLCSNPLPPTPACGGPTFLQHVFPSSPGTTLVGPHGPLASGQPAAFHISTTSLPLSTICWDFGDGSPKLDMAGPAATHRYVLPGHYHVTAVLTLGASSITLETEVQVEVAPAALELVCPSSVHRDESLELSIRNRGGSDLEATYSILALGEEPVQGRYLSSWTHSCLPSSAWLGLGQSPHFSRVPTLMPGLCLPFPSSTSALPLGHGDLPRQWALLPPGGREGTLAAGTGAVPGLGWGCPGHGGQSCNPALPGFPGYQVPAPDPHSGPQKGGVARMGVWAEAKLRWGSWRGSCPAP